MHRILTVFVMGAFLLVSGLAMAGDRPEATGSEAAAASPAKAKEVKSITVAKKGKKGKKGAPNSGETK